MDSLQKKILDQFVIDVFDDPNNSLYLTYRIKAFGFYESRSIPRQTVIEAPNGWVQVVIEDMLDTLFKRIDHARLNQR